MNITGLEIFEELLEIHNEQTKVPDKYPKMLSLLERACKELKSQENIQFPNLFSRLNYVCQKFQLDKWKTYLVNSF
jgi:hypothetical protein